ncbi:MAG: pilus assembly FimT family protein [Bacillota bacterium]
MRYKYMRDKGYSLIELMLVVALIVMIMIPIGSFFFINFKTFFRADNEIETQSQVQIAMTYFTEKAIEAKSIYSINDSAGAVVNLNSSVSVSISRIVIYNIVDANYLIYEHKDADGDGIMDFCFAESTDPNHIAPADNASYIDSIEIEPLQGQFSSCRGIRISISSSKKDSLSEITNDIYFRNYNTQ